MTDSEAKFSIGQLIHHRAFDYRGVIVDVDPQFASSEEWYQKVALSRPPKDKPWYHILPDGAQHTTYVAERNLEPDETDDPIEHPQLSTFFQGFQDGRYVKRKLN
jgi:heat shock protein HspQ